MNLPQISDLHPGIRLTLGVILGLGALVFIMALRHPAEGPKLTDLNPANSDWIKDWQRPTPAATPQPHMTAARPRAAATPPAQPTPTPRATPCQPCIERQQRYLRAVETGLGSDHGSKHHEVPVITTLR